MREPLSQHWFLCSFQKMTIGINVYAKLWSQQGIHQAELAAALGVRQQFVSKVETGERKLDIMEMLEIAEALRMDIPTLLQQLGK